jgi:hypothetical protein
MSTVNHPNRPLPTRDQFLSSPSSLRRVRPEDLTDGDIPCTICLEAYGDGDEPENPVRLPCGHVVGERCIQTHLNSLDYNGLYQNTCPFRCELYQRTDSGRPAEFLNERHPRAPGQRTSYHPEYETEYGVRSPRAPVPQSRREAMRQHQERLEREIAQLQAERNAERRRTVEYGGDSPSYDYRPLRDPHDERQLRADAAERRLNRRFPDDEDDFLDNERPIGGRPGPDHPDYEAFRRVYDSIRTGDPDDYDMGRFDRPSGRPPPGPQYSSRHPASPHVQFEEPPPPYGGYGRGRAPFRDSASAELLPYGYGRAQGRPTPGAGYAHPSTRQQGWPPSSTRSPIRHESRTQSRRSSLRDYGHDDAGRDLNDPAFLAHLARIRR